MNLLEDTDESKDPIHVLALDGGILMGVMPAEILSLVQSEILDAQNRKLRECFHWIAGTSTGGLIASALAKKTNPMDPAEVRDLYLNDAQTIFPKWSHGNRWDLRPLKRAITSLGGLRAPKFGAKGLESVLLRTLKDDRLADANPPLLIPTYDSVRKAPVFFSTPKATANPETHDWALRDVCRATSAGPTFLPAFKVNRPDEKPARYFIFSDGGLFANNPSMCVIVEALRIHRTQWLADHPGATSDDYGKVPPIRLLSLGCGTEHARDASTKEDHKEPTSMPKSPSGAYSYAHIKDIITMLRDGTASTVAYQAGVLNEEPHKYLRIQPFLNSPKFPDALDSRPEALEEWRRIAQRAFEHHKEQLEEFFSVEPTKMIPANPPASRGSAGQPGAAADLQSGSSGQTKSTSH